MTFSLMRPLILLAVIANLVDCTLSRYFLSVAVRVSANKVHLLEQFVQHYLEEGVEHFFIYNDDSKTAISKGLLCISKDNYTIFSEDSYTTSDSEVASKFQHQAYRGMYIALGVREWTEWLIMADLSQFMTSRASPDKSLREILSHYFTDCGIISVPELAYAIEGRAPSHSRGGVRYTQKYRWSYNTHSAVSSAIATNTGSGHNPFADATVENMIIIRTSQIENLKRNQVGFFGNEEGGWQCIPRVMGPMTCAEHLKPSQVQSFSAVKQNPDKTGGVYRSFSPDPTVNLTKWCPFANRFVASESPERMVLLEEDIHNMQIVSFHYLAKSVLIQKKLLHVEPIPHPQHSTHQDNHVEILDDFMSSTRLAARVNNVDFKRAESMALKLCPNRTAEFEVKQLATAGGKKGLTAGDVWKGEDMQELSEILVQTGVDAHSSSSSSSSSSSFSNASVTVSLSKFNTSNGASFVNSILAKSPQHVLADVHDYPPEKIYFFSVMVFVRDEANTMLEFVRHYIEEGADHIFIFDDDSSDGTATSVLACIDSKYYTVYNRTDFGSEVRLSQHEAYLAMYLVKGVKFRTHWLAVVDGDEMITSRAYPELPVREILNERFRSCGMISVPWNLYAWGDRAETPLNNLRYSLNYRLGYDKKYDLNVSETSKFRERWNGESNKVIFQTSKVFYFMNTHNARFSRETGRISTVCIPHTSSRMECTKSLGSKLFPEAFHRVPQNSSRYFKDESGSTQGLSQFCPFSNTYRAYAGPWRTYIAEQDINELQLACFHYRIKSKADFLRKTQGDRFNAWEYENATEAVANRMDIYDDFMSSVRRKARAKHPYFLAATQALSSCPAQYFDPAARPGSEMVAPKPATLLAPEHQQLTVQPRYFLSVMVIVRDESDALLEFMQHYIEEGVEHFFIFNDGSTDGTWVSKKCVDHKYYTTYDRKYLKQNVTDAQNPQRELYSFMYNEMGVRDRTHWLAVVDADELITSRSKPQKSIKELLLSSLSHCDIVSVPWLLYSWGDRMYTPRNKARSELNYRWGYDKRYELPVRDHAKFTNRNKGVENKVIFRTNLVPTFEHRHVATISPTFTGTVCIPSEQPFSCASNLNASVVSLFGDMKQRPAKNKGFYKDVHNNDHGLAQWCPFSSKFSAAQSPHKTLVTEDDIDHLQLACFHYQFKSKADWLRKTTDSARFNHWEFKGAEERHANRPDVLDSFMTTVRKPARQAHPSFTEAAAAVAKCDPVFYDDAKSPSVALVRDPSGSGLGAVASAAVVVPPLKTEATKRAPSSKKEDPAPSQSFSLVESLPIAAIDSQLQQSEGRHFFSVMTQVRAGDRAAESLLEFVLHYLEEGVDHFYIFEELSYPPADGAAVAGESARASTSVGVLLQCVDKTLYTVFTSEQFLSDAAIANGDKTTPKAAKAAKVSQSNIYKWMYRQKSVRSSTRWLAMLELDEFMTSRAFPHVSLRELLDERYDGCGVVTAPRLTFAWGDTVRTPVNEARYQLRHRLGYDKKYAAVISGDRYSKYNNPIDGGWQDGEKNRLIIRTDAVPSVSSAHRVSLNSSSSSSSSSSSFSSSSLSLGLVCVAHAETELSCSSQCRSNAPSISSMQLSKTYLTSRDHSSESEAWTCSAEDLPRWCRRSTRYHAQEPDKCTMFQEADVDRMTLMTFHYRVKSSEHWRSLAAAAASGSGSISEDIGAEGLERLERLEKDANRADVFDDFMAAVRKEARRAHPLFVRAQQLMQNCPLPSSMPAT